MAFTLQQLRSSSAGTKPGDLEAGQLAFNLADSKGYLGNGTSLKTAADGSTTAANAGKGWIEFDLKATNIASLISSQFLTNPATWTVPAVASAGQVLTWDAAANSGAGGYTPKTPGSVDVYSIANDAAALNASSGNATGDLVAGLVAATSITAKTDLSAGDLVVVTDSGNVDASGNVTVGSYIYDGTNFIAMPSGGHLSYLNDLLNVNTATATVAAANQAGVLVRDSSVATETSPNAYKLVTTLDLGTY